MRFPLIVAIALGCGFSAGSLQAAPTAAQRKELVAIRRQLIKVPGLLRRRKVDEARQTVEAAEKRLNDLIKSANLSTRDRTVLGVKRLLDFQKRRLQKLPSNKPPPKTKTGQGRTVKVTGKPVPGGRLEQKRRAERKAEQDRLERDLGYWRRILAGQPSAAEKQRAHFHLGVLNLRAHRWKAAQSVFETLLKEFPDGPWAISARCRLIDIKLEYAFDLQGAKADAETLITWSREREKTYFPPRKKNGKKTEKKAGKPQDGRAKPSSGQRKEAVKNASKKVERRRRRSVEDSAKKGAPAKRKVPSEVFETPTEQRSLAEAYRRYSLVKFIQGGLGHSRLYLQRVRSLEGVRRGRQSPEGISWSMVLGYSLRRRPLTPLSVWKSNKPSFPYIAFGDVLYSSQSFERARDYATKLLDRKSITLSDYQKSYVYYLRGRSYNGIRDRQERQRAGADFLKAQQIDPQAPWADRCLFLAANARWNHAHDAKGAIDLWKKLLKEYPKSREWDRSAYYIGVIHEQEKRYAEAKSAYKSLLEARPKTPFAKLTKEHLKSVQRELNRR